MSEAEQELYSLLIPLAEERLLVPRACVAEVVDFADPEGEAPNVPWHLGEIRWDGRLVPAISFEGCCGGQVPVAGRRSRLVIFHATTDKLPGRFFAVLSQGFPQLVRVSPGVLSTEHGRDSDAQVPVLCRLRMVNEHPLIPDLERLEAMVGAAGDG